MAEGIIWGGKLLPEDEFIEIFIEWYQEKGQDFINALDTKIIIPISNMIKKATYISATDSSKTKTAWHRVEGEYSAIQIYKNWEMITEEFFGNGKVQIIAGISVDGKNELEFTKILDEAEVVTDAGIDITRSGLTGLNSQLENMQSIFAAASIQGIINSHYNNLTQSLDEYHINSQEAYLFHSIISNRGSAILKRYAEKEHLTNTTYDETVFYKQNEGKKWDAYMNHVGNYHQELLSLFNSDNISGEELQSIKISNNKECFSFKSYFKSQPEETQVWLLDSLNTAAWFTGGDIVVIGDNNEVIYNIQLKTSTQIAGKNFELALSSLRTFANGIKNRATKPGAALKIAKYMYKRLKTTSANDIKKGEETIEKKIVEKVKKTLSSEKVSVIENF